jgi:hypothetical protein
MSSATTVGLVVDISRCQGRGGEPSPQSLLDNLLNPSVTSSAQTRATKEELGGRGGDYRGPMASHASICTQPLPPTPNPAKVAWDPRVVVLCLTLKKREGA